MQRVFPDSKTFVDAIAKDTPAVIVQRYQEEKQELGFDLAGFVARNFTVQRPKDSGYRSIPGQDVCSHIDSLWSVLAREPDRADPRSSLLPLPYHYVVPGGRFNETTIGIPTSPCSDLRRAAAATWRSTWSGTCQPHHALWPCPEWELHLLSQSLATSLLRRHG